MSGSSSVNAFHEVAKIAPAPKKRRGSPTYSIRFTLDERALLEREAGKLSLSAHIRAQLFSNGNSSMRRRTRKPRKISAEIELLGKLLGALAESGALHNLNRLANAAEIGALPITPELTDELKAACITVELMRQDLLKALGVTTQ